MRCGAPDCEWRTTKMSASIATRLSTVSSSVSPLLVDDAPMLRLMTSADSRLAAISNVVRVRVEFSKNRLNTALPRSSGTFFTSRSAIDTNGSAVSRMLRMTSARQAFEREQMRELAVRVELRIAHRHQPACFSTASAQALAVARQHDRQVARDGEARAAVRGLDRQLAAAAVDQHGELDARGPAEVEQLVDRGAHAAAGVEHVVDEHDGRAVDVERQRRALGCRPSSPVRE